MRIHLQLLKAMPEQRCFLPGEFLPVLDGWIGPVREPTICIPDPCVMTFDGFAEKLVGNSWESVAKAWIEMVPVNRIVVVLHAFQPKRRLHLFDMRK